MWLISTYSQAKHCVAVCNYGSENQRTWINRMRFSSGSFRIDEWLRYIANSCDRWVRRTYSRFNMAKSLSASRQRRGKPGHFGALSRASFASTSPMGFYICTGLMIERRLPRGKWKLCRKKLFVTVSGIDDPDKANNSSVGIAGSRIQQPTARLN
jgi:hypothetical protein